MTSYKLQYYVIILYYYLMKFSSPPFFCHETFAIISILKSEKYSPTPTSHYPNNTSQKGDLLLLPLPNETFI